MPALNIAVAMRLSTELLRREYTDARKTIGQIAAEQHATPDLVRAAMRRADIPVRHGSASYVRFGYSGDLTRKMCPSCRVEQPRENFHRDKRNACGRTAYCRICQGLRIKQYATGYAFKRRLRKAALVRSFGDRCAHCGVTHLPIDAFTFHHHSLTMADERYIAPATVISSPNAKHIERERQHWIMLCANCHAIHHGCQQTAEQLLSPS